MAEKGRHFFVYTLIDPRCGSVFYVGKGQGRRSSAHVAEWRRGIVVNQAKFDRIDAIMKAGRRPEECVVYPDLTEPEALMHETALIEDIGRDKLTNGNAGGLGWGRLRKLYDKIATPAYFEAAIQRGGNALWLWSSWVLHTADMLGISKLDPATDAMLNDGWKNYGQYDEAWNGLMAGVAVHG